MSDEGDDSPPPRPRRNIKRIVLASSSGSESDDSGPATSTRKKRLRVLSDEDSESSGSSVVVGNRRRRALPKLRDSDGDSDSSGWATERSGATAGPRPVAANPTSGFASDSSEGNSDKCSICLMRFTDQQVGTPQTCEHIFCLDCITEWSRNVNTCPVDRMTFDCIVVRACAGGRVLSTQPVTVVERPPSVEMLLMEDSTSCEICGSSSSEDTMLLCDGCDLGFHMECLTPPLTRVPTNQWLCPSCNDRFEGFDVVQISGMDELFSEEEGGSRALGPRARRPAPGPARRPAAGPAPRAGPSSSRAAAPRARARKRHRRRTVIIEYELEENGKFPVTKRIRRKLKRRKTKRRQPRTAARRALVRESVRAKLAAQAGVRAAAAARLHAARASLAPPLSLFGSPHDLDYFSDDEPAAGGGALAARAPAAPACLARAARRQARRKLAPSPPPAAAAPDLLDAILESQTLLHARRPHRAPAPRAAPAPRVDVRAARGAARQAPSYGQPRNGGGWGGGYRYPAERAPAPGAAPTHAQYDNGYGAPAAHAERRRDDGEPHAAERARYAEQPAARRRPEPAWPPRRPPRDPPPADKRAAPAPDDEDAGLVIDTDKYDPTEPTDDDDVAPAAPAALPAPPALPALLDSAVRQVLLEHRGLVPEPARALSDDGSDGDCPNFSIYSATSVHIASGALAAAEPAPPEPAPPAMHDLVQEDGADEPDAPPEQPAPAPPPDDAAKRKTDEYNEKVSKRCPITTNTRNPIKIKLNTPALIRRQVSLYDEEDVEPEPDEPAEPCAAPPEPAAPSPPAATPLETDRRDIERTPDPEPELERDSEPEPELEPESEPEPEPEPELEPEPDPEPEPDLEMEPEVETADDVKEDDSAGRAGTPPAAAASREKMTESISETEDERSYTPCLDEHRDDRDALDGLDTELISEDEGHGLFSEDERREPAPAPPAPDPARKKKKKDAKREAKERKGKKRADVAFKKAAKAKERHYRERDSGSGSPDSERRRKREKRKDLERYDVRTLVSEKRRRTKDAFGRDVSPEPPHRASAEPEPPPEPRRARAEPSPRRARASPSPRRGRASPSPRRPRVSPSPTPPPAPRRSASPRAPRRRRSASRGRRASARRRRSGSRGRKRRRSGSAPAAAKPKAKKKKRARSARSRSRSAARRKSPKRKRVRRRSGSARRSAEPAWSPRPASPRTPPPQPAPPPVEARRARKRRDRSKHRRPDNPGPSKEVFTSGDNILVSVSFKEAEGGARRPARRRRRAPAEDAAPAKPVAIIDLERSPFRELTPSPERVIVLSDDERPAAPEPPPAGPKTPPEPGAAAAPPPTPPEPPDSPDAYDPYEPTASPAPPEPPAMTLEAAQKTNLSADDVLDRRPLEPIEKVMALLQSTREAPPEPPPDAGAAPEPPPKPKPFAAKPSPIKSDPIKPMPQTGKVSRLPLPARGDSPYSPGSSDFGDLFEPPPAAPAAADDPPRRKRRQTRKKGAGKTQVDVKLDDDNLKVLDELPSSAVELQVKSKFLKKLNRQERVVEEVKLVLKPHYNKKRVSKDEYKHILRRAVPKICHNKTGEINPTKIQALVEAYVKKFRKKHKLGLS